MDKYLELKRVNPYIKGIVSQDIDLSMQQKLKLLFCKGITITLVSPKVKNYMK